MGDFFIKFYRFVPISRILYRFCPPEVVQNRVPRWNVSEGGSASALLRRDAQFCSHLWWTKLAIVIYLGQELLRGSSGTSVLRRTRPCIWVRILPFHSRISTGFLHVGGLAFRHQRHWSHLCPCGRRALPATLLPAAKRLGGEMFGLSSQHLF